MASLKVLLRTTHPRKDGTFPIVFKITANRKHRFITSDYHVKLNQFKDGVVIRHPDAPLINNAIEIKRAALMAEVIKADITGQPVNQAQQKELTMFQAMAAQMEHFESVGKVASFNRMGISKRMLKECWEKDLPLSKITGSDVDKYIEYRRGRGNNPNTIKKALRDLATVMTFAGWAGINPFKKQESKIKPQGIHKEKLTAEEIKLLEGVELSGPTDMARDMFLFSFYTQGMRFENVATFKMDMIVNGHIHYRMNKSSKTRQIEIHPKLQALIDKYKGKKGLYLFPAVTKEHNQWNKKDVIGTANANMNTYLKRAAILAGIDKKISMHISKHTFAMLSLKMGVNYSILKDALGHSNYATTQKYLNSLDEGDINKAVRGLYE